MQLAVDTQRTHDAMFMRNNTPVRRASCQLQNDTAGVRVQAPAWACVFTHPQSEHWAEGNLRRKGYETWLPMVAVRRRDRVVRTMWHTVEVPAFSRYVFVRHTVGEPFTPIRYTEGVANLLTMDGFPLHASGEAVEALRAVLVAAGPPDSHQPPEWLPGASVRLSAGGLKLDGVVLSVAGNMAQVATVMLGQLRNVTVPTSHIIPRD